GVMERLGSLPEERALPVALAGLNDPDEAIRGAAARALSNLKSDVAIGAVLDVLPGASPEGAAAILRALGGSQSPRALAALRQALLQPDPRRRAAVEGLVTFAGEPA